MMAFRAERRAVPSRPGLAMRLPVEPAGIAIPSGDRLAYPRDEGLT